MYNSQPLTQILENKSHPALREQPLADGRLPPKIAYNGLMDELDTAAVFKDAYWKADRDMQIIMIAHYQIRKLLTAMIHEDTKPLPKK